MVHSYQIFSCEYSSYQHSNDHYLCIQQGTEEITLKIQKKKEELYDVICKAEQSFWTSSFSNKRLLRHLSVQVNPRLEDSKWYDLRIYAVVYSLFLCCVTGVDIIPFDGTYLQATSALFKMGYQCGGDSGARCINQSGCFCRASFERFPRRQEGSPGIDDKTNARTISGDESWPD
jgi:hypothetical protein